jgi:hypothetical protein
MSFDNPNMPGTLETIIGGSTSPEPDPDSNIGDSSVPDPFLDSNVAVGLVPRRSSARKKPPSKNEVINHCVLTAQ